MKAFAVIVGIEMSWGIVPDHAQVSTPSKVCRPFNNLEIVSRYTQWLVLSASVSFRSLRSG